MSGAEFIKKIRTHYAERLPAAERWDDPTFIYSLRNPVGYYQSERVRRTLLQVLNRNGVRVSDKCILDIGCGTSSWLRFFAELCGDCRKMCGIDLSPNSLNRGKQINPGIQVLIGDARKLPFPDEQFDIISQFVCFEHFMEPHDLAAASEEVIRVLTPGGWLIWQDILPVQSDYQRGFTLDDVRQLFPMFDVVESLPLFRRFALFGLVFSTAYGIAARSALLADLLEKLPFGKPTNLIVLLRKPDISMLQKDREM